MRDGWAAHRLADVVEVTMGRQRSPRHATGEHLVPYLRAANVKDGRMDLSDVKCMNFTPAEQTTFTLRNGDVLVTEGCGSIAQVGAAAVWHNEIPGPVCFQNTLLRLRSKPAMTLPGFVWVWASHAFASGLFAAVASGTNIFHIGSRRAQEMPMLVPPLDEQRRIVDLVDAVDAAEGRASRLVSAVGDALTVVSTALLDGDANRMPLGDLLADIDGGRSPVTEGRAPTPGERSVLKLSAVRPGRFKITERKALIPGTDMPERAIAQDGDVLITRSNTASTVGYACQVEKADGLTYLSDLTLRLHPIRDRLDPAYLVEALCSQGVRSQIEGSARGTSGSMRKISRELIRGYVIPVPSMDRQRQIAGDLRAMRTMSDRAEQEQDALRHLRSSLLDRLLSGDHRIPESYDELLEAV